jgi:predicted NBD/HSP70 family sugar kinase
LLGDESARRNARLWINPSRYLAVGVQHKVDSLKAVLLDAGMNVLERESYPMDKSTGEERAHHITRLIQEFVNRDPRIQKNIVRLGFSDFIPHDIGTGMKTKSIWMPGWGDVNIKADIESVLGIPTEIMRCTDAYSFAEHIFGDCRMERTFITVQLDEGIGLSVFKEHGFLKGTTDIFGELGHIVHREAGEICKCGNRGCLETVAGIDAIEKKVRENVEKGAYFRLPEDAKELCLEDIVANAKEGNKLALLSIREAAKAIGDALAVVVNVLGITRIVLYGRLVQAGTIATEQIARSLQQHCIYPLNQDAEICVSSLDEFGSSLGAAYAAMRSLFLDLPLRI